MFIDQKRTEAYDEICRRDRVLFAHILTPGLFFQAARRCGLTILLNPLNLINLVWLAVSAARNPDLCFADILHLSLKTLQDHESFPGSLLARLLDASGEPAGKQSRHDPRKHPAEPITEEAFCKARKRLPSEFWVALFFLLGEQFQLLYADVVRWRRFRLMAIDGTEIMLPDWPALRQHFGTANNSGGTHGPQARLVLLQFPQARLPYAYVLAPRALGENSMARQLLRGLSPLDLVLLDAGFLCYGLLWQIEQQKAFFCLRLKKNLNLSVIKELSKETGANDVLVQWTPKDSRGNWRKEGLPRSMILRLLTYHAKGFRPLRLLSNVLNEEDVPYEQFWGLSVSEEGEVLFKGVYNLRWEIEGAFHELTVALNCELNTLGYPRAALFGFCVAVVAYNVLAVLKAALRAVHGEEKVAKEVSGYYMALEWSLVYSGMMIALPAQQWECFAHMPAAELAGYLRDWAGKVNMDKIKKAPPRKPTKQKSKRIKDSSPHVSTARLLAEAKEHRRTKPKVCLQR